MAKVTEYGFESKDERHTHIRAVKWEPDDGRPVAVLQIVHGMQEYIDRYSEFATFLAEKGFAVCGHDHIGHGMSVEYSEDRGIMHCARPDDVMVDDMYTHYEMITGMYPDIPYFILGHSMGSYLLRKYLSVKSHLLGDVKGAIIMGTGTEPDGALIAGRIICNIVAAVKGRDYRSKFIPKLMFNSNYKQFDITGKDPENSWLSKNTENVLEFLDKSKPMNRCDFSVNGYRILICSTWFDNRMSNIRKMNMDIPVIFVSGELDPVGALGKGAVKAYEKFKAAGVKDLSIKLYEGDRHEILNETDREIVYNDLYDWMLKRF